MTITYTIPEAFEPEEQVISYNLSYLKQPGIDQDEYSLELFYPRQFQPTQAPFRTVKSAGKLQFEDSIKEDVRLEFVFLRR